MINKRLVLAACFITAFTAYSVRYGYGILLPSMLDPLNISKTEAGAIFSAFFIAYTVGSPICGFIGDKYGPRWLLGSFITLLGIGALLMSFANSLAQAIIFFTIAGIGSAACWAPVIAVAQKWSAPERRGRTLAYIDIGSGLGIMAMGLCIPLIVKVSDWRTGWVVLGAMTIASGIFNWAVMKNPPEAAGGTVKKPSGIPVKELLKSVKFWLFATAYFFAGISYAIPFTFLSTYGNQEAGLSYTAAANIMTVLGAGAIISKLTIGPLSDRTGRLKMVLLCSLFIFIGLLGMMLRNQVTIYVSSFIFSLGYGAIWAMYAAAAGDYFSVASSGTVLGIWTLFLGCGSTLAPILSGWAADATGTLSWSFGIGASGGLISMALLLPMLGRGKGAGTVH
jgi:MFS family permease